jgi:hypothetical protein
MHEACIETSCRVIDDVRHRHHYMDSEPTLAAFYNFLNTRYIDRHRKAYPNDEFSNDIFDLCHCSRLYGPRSVLAMTRLEWWGGGYDVCVLLIGPELSLHGTEILYRPF